MIQNKKVLFVGDSTSFLINSVRSELKKKGFDSDTCKLEVTQISKLAADFDMFFIMVDERAVEKKEALIYVRDQAIEYDKKMYLFGYADELKSVTDMIPTEALGGSFERPIDVKKIIDTMVSEMEHKASGENLKHILVVDDSGTMLRTIKSWLEDSYRVSMVNSATSAISFLAVNKPDLILLDYEMPVCSGPMMLQMIRSEITTESIPVIFLTSKGDKESVAKVLSLKPQGYLLKSMPSQKIVEAIDNFFLTQKAKGL